MVKLGFFGRQPVAKDRQLKKALWPISTTELGTPILLREWQCEKAPWPMDVTELGSSISVQASQPVKA
jgi:hypothetical protein